MFDNICSLPFQTDIFSQAAHPSQPIFTIGLASGHVYSHRLPDVGHVADHDNDDDTSISSDKSTRSKRNGFDKVERVWETRRHKGSCRSLCYSADGRSLFSAGSDGLVKAADFGTGQVSSKIAVPVESETSASGTPTIIHALSPQTLLLGTEETALHLYDLRKNNFTSSKPQQTYNPHDDYVSSISPLSSSDASTSASNKHFVSTGATTLAVTDIRKGVIAQSEDQKEALLCSAFVDKLHTKGNNSGATSGKVLVGGAGGVLTLWQQGLWDDQDERVVLDRSPGGGETLDVITKVPDEIGKLPGKKVAVGLGNGQIRFVRIGNASSSVGQVRHDEVEGVVAVDFDVSGRMISSGGAVVKIWHEKVEDRVYYDEDGDVDGDDDDDDDDGYDWENDCYYADNNYEIHYEDGEEEMVEDDGDGNGDRNKQGERISGANVLDGTRKRKAADGVVRDGENSDNEDVDEQNEEEKPHRRRKRRRNKSARPNSGPGIMAFNGL